MTFLTLSQKRVIFNWNQRARMRVAQTVLWETKSRRYPVENSNQQLICLGLCLHPERSLPWVSKESSKATQNFSVWPPTLAWDFPDFTLTPSYLFDSGNRVCMTLHQLLPGDGFCFGCTWDLVKERVWSGGLTLTSLEPALHCFLKAQHTARTFLGETNAGAAATHKQRDPPLDDPL